MTEVTNNGIHVSKTVIANIRRKTTWNNISDEYFDNSFFDIRHLDGSKIQISNTDVELVCSLIIEFDGKISKIEKYLRSIGKNYISYAVIKSIKNKESHTDISDKYFSKGAYDLLLAEQDVRLICEKLVVYKNSYHATRDVYNALKDIIPNLSKSEINHIKGKAAWKRISDQYF